MSTIYGISSTGWLSKPYQTILQDLYTRWTSGLGKIDTDPDGAFGQLGRSLALSHAELWDIMDSIFSNSDPRTAQGEHLDKFAATLGLSRKSSTYARSTIYVGGAIGTVISQNSQVTQSSSNKAFNISKTVTISKTCNEFKCKIPPAIVVGSTYGFTLNNVVITHVAEVGDDQNIVANNIVEQLYANAVVCDISEAVNTSGEIKVSSFIPYRTFVVGSEVNCTIPWASVYTDCTCAESGVNVTPAESINKIRTPIVGWDYVRNPINGDSGSYAETDTDLRKRLKKGSQLGAAGTEYAIESKLWNNVSTISNVLVWSNRNDTIDIFGNPPRSVKVVVEGGSDAEIGNQLYQVLPCGIATAGEISYTVDPTLTGNSNDTTVKFSRTKLLFGWIKVTILEKNSEEPFPSNAESLIRSALFSESVNTIALGNDVIAQRYIGAIYRAVTGIANIKVEVAVTGSATGNPSIASGSFTNTNLSYSSGWQTKVTVAPSDKVEWRDANNSNRIQYGDVTL